MPNDLQERLDELLDKNSEGELGYTEREELNEFLNIDRLFSLLKTKMKLKLKNNVGENGMNFTRITIDPAQMGGVPCIRGLRIPVATVVDMVAAGMSTEEILTDYPDLDREDITEALRYASAALRERQLPQVANL